ncbi:uncharacterized protein [Palaemon carinicauda]|uniref:uncharacterized protein n=1 Tax=Palaemon carinicauda TaxID=392227 RepID=UPI0035B62C4B
MRFAILLPICVLALLPLCEPTFIVESAAAGTTTVFGLGVGTSTSAAAVAAGAAGAVAVAGALIVGGVIAAAIASRRGKREAGPMCLPMNNPDMFISLAASSDTLGCGMRLVCEVEATPDELLSPEEKLVLGLFGRQVKPATFSELKSPKAGFQYAALVGANAKNASECGRVFDQCPYDRSSIMELFNATK